jgi:NAD(P)-dependent dehydrogenase (short-subunit alcohol dehydrogenase family)
MRANGVALVTGSSRGIGREVARQLVEREYEVIVTARKRTDAERAAKDIGADHAHPLEVSDPKSVDALAKFVGDDIKRLDVLVNNAAILLDEGESITDVDASAFEKTWRANTLGPIVMTQRFAPLLRASKHGRVVNVSSGAGQLSRMTSYAPAYSISKAALNASTILFANALKRDGVLVNCADPGWVRTDMGGRGAPRSVSQGADTIVWLATLPDDGPTGLFFHDRKPVAW